MKKIIFLLVFIFAIKIKLFSSVDFGGTWVTLNSIQPACLGQIYINVGFHVNWEVNNAAFQIQRSKDSNFSWTINGTAGFNGNMSGCGTCGAGMYAVNDYGPFLPNETWYYRVKATSNNANFQYHYLGSFTSNNPSVVNWISQVTNLATSGSSPSTENSYSWAQDNRDMQGVIISLDPTEINKIYLEQGNNKIKFFVNPSFPYVNLQVNINNTGYNTIYTGGGTNAFVWQGSSASFPTIGTHNLKVRFTDLSNNIMYREYQVNVVPKSDGLYIDNYCNTMRVWKGSDPINGLPLILSEGFDAYNTKAEQYYREAGKDLFSCLLSKGFNIYVVNYSINSQSLVNNAAVFQSAVRYVSSINSNKKVVCTGMSMGGVINRYACAKAEHLGNPLPISKFVSLDAPQQGAVISQTLQDWRKNYTNDPFEVHASDNAAAKELLIYNAYDPNGTIHTNFFNTLNSLNGDGYPHLVEKIGISFSTSSPNINSGLWLQVNFPILNLPLVAFFLSPQEMLAGSYLPALNIDPIDMHKPFLRDATINTLQLKNPTFIPHKSALDIINNVSKFDKVIIPSASGFHDQIPADIIEQIVNAVVEKNVFIQNKNYATARTIIASETILSGSTVSNLQQSGQVNINNGIQIRFKAGKEISLQNGFSSHNGSEFEGIITPVVCNGLNEFQYRLIPSNSILDSTTINSPLDPTPYLNDSSIKIIREIALNNELQNNNEPIGLFPNPTHGIIYINNPNHIYLTYKILSIDNKKLKEGDLSLNQIDLSDFSNGLFLLEITDTNSISHFYKILKN